MKHRPRNANAANVTNSDGHVIGVDLGATAVRAAVLSPQAKGGTLTVSAHGLGSVPLPEGAVVNGVVVNPGAVTAALKQLWNEQKFNCRKVILGVTHPQVVVRDLTVPNLPPDQLRKTLPFRAREVVALPLDQAVLDFSPIGPPNPAAESVTGLLTGIPRQPVATAVQAVTKARLKVVRVDLSPYGLLRSIGNDGPAIEALVDIGAQLTTIVIHVNGIAKVVRVVPHGGAEWTALLADQADLPIDEAETAKRTLGLEGSNQAARALRDAVRPVVTEVRSSIHFFASQNRVTVERVSLTGGSAALPGLADLLGRDLGVPIIAAQPLRHVADQAAQAQGQQNAASAVAVGLAMGIAA